MEQEGKDAGYGTLSADSVSEDDLIPGRAELNGQLVLSAVNKKEFLGIVQKVLEARHQSHSRPLPVLLGGKEVDLLNLSLQVRANGGYDGATVDSRWSFLAERLGFEGECGPALKLVYVKYLKPLESWAQSTSKETNLLLSSESPTRIGLCSTKCVENKQCNSWDGAELTTVSQKRGAGSFIEVVEGHLINGEKTEVCQESGYDKTPSKRRRKGDRLQSTSNLQHAVDSSVGRIHVPIFRGKNSIFSVLEWIKRIALNPGDPKKGQGPCGLKQDETWVQECQTQASRIRTLLWKRKDCMVGRVSGDSSLGLVSGYLLAKGTSQGKLLP
eukprot:c24016_g1_i1 orf=148-1131(+)